MDIFQRDGRLYQRPEDQREFANPRRRAIVAFYASLKYGSEYRAGAEFIRFAAAAGFDLAVIADLEQNAQAGELSNASHGIEVVRIPSPIVRQGVLYRFTDFLPQTFWHRRVGRFLKKSCPRLEVVWVQNGAQPWLPIAPYIGSAAQLIWGPVGGGETLSRRVLDTVGIQARWRELLRQWLEAASVRRKQALFTKGAFAKIIPLARTAASQRQLRDLFASTDIPVIPEILEPVPGVHLNRSPKPVPRFVWVGQDIPRKNLSLALELFARVRLTYPRATLDVYGIDATAAGLLENVRFHGWVSRIDWLSYRDDGVLLLTSYREGLPSAVLEAVREGLLCVTSDVGSVSNLGIPTVHVLPRSEHPCYSDATVSALVSRIGDHLAAGELRFGPVSFGQVLLEHLKQARA